ncbi:predicted transporter subunit: ATP-binding component of ABC superfamily [Aliivibrio fischeri ES114]|uniref:Predicted transporter subunit: ATP-binding component of ABC superfamily n=3 Tax=Aliivibrio fischeri TaxID=668 RepID=Q5DYN3_ALIF1|nr:ABC transporter ATP-binding protein [Aliivibrio fischeri]AAW88113.1 predicted transporter subunit: ATP-binding component of ABC superfamily [Aliivibrio fischeri ES114]KLU80586.1 ABC transporter [Aliivibrio fischeri]MUK44795.1 ATP-binding cassette domain-containing protein [Aliivibrio fischeri]MUK64142.1 ATP-binding cassette domain-containing protein [Aliivibrio fischeri]MUK80454.1 ATP-binding cassette domain-containing protein [Aliivibrio fischeri]
MTIAIKVSSVGKSVISNEAELTILKDISFEVLSGQSVAIVGTSGAGKSTLMTLLAGLDIPSTGDIELLGQNLSQLDDETRAQIRSESIGFVFQSFLLIPSLTALENVTLPAILRGEGEDIKKAKQLLASVGLSGRETHLPSQLSGGEQQRVALARAFMTQPQILFADEPTGNLDQHTAEHIIELLFEMNQKHGTTLVLITHDPKLAERCERTLTIDAGRIFEEVV